jgi:hypothetical protein
VLGLAAAAEIAPAVRDEFRIGPAKPRHRDFAAGMEDRGEIVPAALVAREAPGLDNFGAGQFIAVHALPYDGAGVWIACGHVPV